MDLPTYTNIWRIEKRLYKLYDFRLPMPLPVGQLTVFTAISVPYVVLLTMLGLPFSHTLIWLYILPPGVLTWLATRPVLESKRLPELITSQMRYLAEPRVWCRMAPQSERDVIRVSARVRRRRPRRGRAQAGAAAAGLAAVARRPRGADRAAQRAAERAAARRAAARRAVEMGAARNRRRKPARRQSLPLPAQAALAPRAAMAFGDARTSRAAAAAPGIGVPTRTPARRPGGAAPVPARAPLPPGGLAPVPAQVPPRRGMPGRPGIPARDYPPGPALPGQASPRSGAREVAQGHPAVQSSARAGVPGFAAAAPAGDSSPAARTASSDDLPGRVPGVPSPEQPSAPSLASVPQPAPAELADAGAAPGRADDGADSAAPEAPGLPRKLPMVTVVRQGPAVPPPPVESAIAGPSALRASGAGQRVVVIPGGHRPGKPDRQQRDRARARLPVSGPRTVVLLGCTVGAGQTTTALLLGEVLASARDDSIAVLDLNPNAGSAVRRAAARPALSQAASLGSSRLRVVGADRQANAAGPSDDPPPALLASGPGEDLRLLDQACEENVIVLADPATPAVPRLVAVADQLILIAPATSAAAGAITMTFEWLEAHGHATLAADSILVVNGISRRATPHVEAAERVAVGRCRAIVRVPWDDQLSNPHARKAAPAAAGSYARPGSPDRGAGQQWTGVLSPGAVAAYTALAGVLVVGLADPEPVRADG